MVRTPALGRLVTLAALLLGVGVVAGRLEFVAVGAAFTMAASRLLSAPAAEVACELGLGADRLLEGESVEVSVRISASTGADVVDVDLALGPGLRVVEGERRATVTVPDHGARELVLRVAPARWGVFSVGPVSAVAYSRGRGRATTATAPARHLRVLPRPEPFSAPGAHPFMRALSGSHVSRLAGSGLEFAGVRPYQPGDPLRRVNWRVTSRRRALHVDEHHPERDAEVVLFLDTFVDLGPAGATCLDVGVRAALGIAEHYLERLDRVGLVGFGGVMRWLPSGTGSLQRYRVVDHLIGTEVVATYAWKDLTILPPGCLPPRALLVALSPLLDERAVGAVADAARRGHGVVVVDTAPDPLLPPAGSARADLAHRLWRMERAATIHRLGEIGVPVVPWAGPGTLDVVLGEVARLRTRPRVRR
jgi:uncharacterized protein (DUF58 family)